MRNNRNIRKPLVNLTDSRPQFSLKNVLLGSYMILSILIVAAFSIITSNVTENIITEKENRAVLNSLKNIDIRIALKLDSYAELMNSLAYNETAQHLLKDARTLAEQDRLSLTTDLYNKMNDVNVIHAAISSIQIMALDEKKYRINNDNYQSEGLLNGYFQSPLYQQVAPLNGGMFIDYTGQYSRDRNSLTLIRSINELRGTKPIGVIAMKIRKEALEAILFQDNDLMLAGLIDSSRIIAIDADKSLLGLQSELSIEQATQPVHSFQAMVQGENHFITYLHNDKYQYTLVNRVPVKILYKDAAHIRNVIYSLILFILCAVATIAFFLSKYLVKPINELVGLMKRVHQGDLNSKMEKPPSNEIGLLADNFNQMLETLRNSIPLRREQLISKLLLGRVTDHEYRLQAAELGLPSGHTANLVSVVEISDLKDTGQPDLPVEDVQMLLQKKLAEFECMTLMHNLDTRRVILIMHKDETNLLSQLHKDLHANGVINASIGVGRSYTGYDKIHESYQEALEALHYKHLFGSNEMIFISDIQGRDYSYDQWNAMEDDIVQAVKYMHVGERDEHIKNLFAAFKEQYVSKEMMNRTVANTYLKIFKVMSGLGIELFGGSSVELQIPSLEKLCSHASANDLKREFIAFLQTVARLIGEKREKRVNETIAKAIRIIHESYADSELSVSSITRDLQISENYFSKLFKQETGTNFSQYLTGIRLDAAQKLLLQTDMKVGEIALRVGYNDANYFSQCFKGAYGTSPVKFRGNEL